MNAVYKRLYIIGIFAVLTITVCRIWYVRQHKGSNGFEAPTGLHTLLSNEDSDLEETKKMERSIARFMQQWEIEGASLAVMKDGKLVYSKGFGMADKETDTEMEVRHIFRIASLSKLITATGVMKLWENGRLNLNDCVFGENGILNDPEFRDIKDKRINKITVEHLLRHQAGYSIRAGDPLFNLPSVAKQLGTDLPISFDDMVRYASTTRLRWEPGSTNNYSNLGYVVLSKVIEKVSGMPYETYIRDSILAPIGCADMHIGYSSYEKRFPNEVHYYEPSDAELTECCFGTGKMVPRSYGGSDLQVLSGAGGWVASPTELMKFMAAIDPANQHPSILSAKTIAFMTRDDKKQWPIGWMRTKDGSDWSRTGSLAGTSALLKRQRNGYSWVFVTNTSSWSGSRFTGKIDVLIRDCLAQIKSWPERDLFEREAEFRAQK